MNCTDFFKISVDSTLRGKGRDHGFQSSKIFRSLQPTTLGSVTFQIELCGSQGEPEEWRVQAGLATEFGQLAQIAKNAEAFFNASNTRKV